MYDVRFFFNCYKYSVPMIDQEELNKEVFKEQLADIQAKMY